MIVEFKEHYYISQTAAVVVSSSRAYMIVSIPVKVEILAEISQAFFF